MKIQMLLPSLLFIAFAAFANDPAASQLESLKAHFGEDLHDNEGNKVDFERLKGKTVGIYFSAHWCPPCKFFTPKLVDFRNEHKDKFEVVFVSSDHDAEAMKGYMKEANMPWLALGYRSETASALAEKYQVRGIPTLVVLAPDGSVKARDGRGIVQSGKGESLFN